MKKKKDISKSVVDAAKNALVTTVKKKPAVLSATAALRDMKPQIDAARLAGRTWAEIAEILKASGLSVSVSLLAHTLGTPRGEKKAAPAPAPAAPVRAPAAPAAAPAPAPAPAAPVRAPAAPAAAPAPAQAGKLSDRLRAEQAEKAAEIKKSDTNPVIMNGDGTFKINPVTEKL